MLPKLVILDRDGVINYDSPDYIKSPEEWIPIESSLQAIRLLNDQGILVGVASNQRGIGRGLYDEATLALITEKMYQACADVGAHIDAWRYCPALERTHPDHKPNPGMLLSIMDEFNISPQNDLVYFVGDKLSDVEAGINAKCLPIMVETGYGKENCADAIAQYLDLPIYSNLLAFVEALLKDD